MRTVLIPVLFALLAACAGQQGGADKNREIPEGAIPAGEDVYYVPLDYTDNDGCRPYRLYSPTKLVTQAIYYRKEDGGFTMNKMQAACYGGQS